jgi:undecaprenyl-diphosphatase
MPATHPSRLRDVLVRAGTLVAAAAVILAVIIGLGLIVARVLPGTDLDTADTAVDAWLLAHRTPLFNDLSVQATDLVSTTNVIVVGLLTAAVSALLARRWWPAVFVVVTMVGEVSLFLTSAMVVGRPRPPLGHLDAVLPPTSSFPSGHTCAAICLFGGIAVLVWHATRAWWRWIAVALAVLLVVAVAWSRMYRAAHYPSDVLGALLLAGAWLTVTTRTLVPGRTSAPRSDRTPPLASPPPATS